MKNWQPVDYMAFLLVLAVVYALVMMGVLRALGTAEISELSHDLIAQFLAGIITIIGAYFGARLNRKDDE